MRPEYVQAVNAVAWGWSLWLIPVLPALVVWLTRIWFRPAGIRGTVTVLSVASLAGIVATQHHAERITYLKLQFAVTDAEFDDWANSQSWWFRSYGESTGVAPIALPPILVYSCLHWLLASVVLRRRSSIDPKLCVPGGSSGDGQDDD